MAETYTGQVQNGVIVLDEGTPPLPEGMKVRIEPAAETVGEGPTLFERLRSIIGSADGLPADMAEQHDHSIHGTPKRCGVHPRLIKPRFHHSSR
jgi:hypothetical protein